MLKVILDTNVLVSSLIQRSYPFLIIDSIFANREIELCSSDDLLYEYTDVLTRVKFFKYPDFDIRAKILLLNIREFATKYFINLKLNIILEDESDNRFLELAEICSADYLITGNNKHFPMKDYKTTKIVSPREFWESVFNQPI